MLVDLPDAHVLEERTHTRILALILTEQAVPRLIDRVLSLTLMRPGR